MAIIRIEKQITRREGALFVGKVLEGAIVIDNPVKGSLLRPYFGEFKVNLSYPEPIRRDTNVIFRLNGKSGPDHRIAKAGDDLMFFAKYEQDNGLKDIRIMNANRGKMPLYLLSGSDTEIPESEELKNILKEQEDLLDKDVTVKGIWHPRLNNIGLILQGGGVAGAFGAGALGLLEKNSLLSKKYLKSIGGASTGSLTAAALIAGQNTRRGKITDTLEENYLTLDSFSDMGRIRSTVKRLMNSSEPIRVAVEKALYGKTKDFDPGYIVEKLIEELNLFEAAGLILGTAATIFGGPFGATIGGGSVIAILTSNLADAVQGEAKKLNKLKKVRSSLATLEPTRTKLQRAFRGISLDSKTNLRIALTSYESGATAYFTEKGTLLYPKYDEEYGIFLDDQLEEYEVNKIEFDKNDQNIPNGGFEGSQNKTNLFIEACLTSGAFPSIFDPKVISFIKKDQPHKEFRETFYDGGIRENLPLNEIRKTQVSSIIAIHNSPVNEKLFSPNSNDSNPPFDVGVNVATHSLDQYALRALGLMNNEIVQEDIDLDKSLEFMKNQQLDKTIHIAPSVSVIGLTETNPIRIKLTMFYGYMRAFDALYLAEAKEIRNQRIRNQKINIAEQLIKNTDEIILSLSLAIEQPADLIANSLLEAEDNPNKFETYQEIRDSFNRPVFARERVKIKYVALSSIKAKAYYSHKQKILSLYKHRLDLTNQNKDSLPYDKDYNLFLTESFFRFAWSSCDLYPLEDVARIDHNIYAQGILKIVNSSNLGFQQGGGNFRIHNLSKREKKNEARNVFNTRRDLNNMITDFAKQNIIIDQNPNEQSLLRNKWKSEMNIPR